MTAVVSPQLLTRPIKVSESFQHQLCSTSRLNASSYSHISKLIVSVMPHDW